MPRWLVKTEPSEYAFSDLVREGRTVWEGVSNALARQHLRAMKSGDPVLVYHTGSEKAVVGLARVAADPRPDPADATGKAVVVELVPVAAARTPVPLASVRAEPRCARLALVTIPRLSVMPVDDDAWKALSKAAGLPAR